MRKKTRDELDRLRKDINDLNVMVYQIAMAAGVVAIRTPEQKAGTRWVRQDSEEWKAECEKRRKEQEILAAMARAQAQATPPTYLSPNSGVYPGEWMWP